MPDQTPEPFDLADLMCPNCVTPWKCNGPHLGDQTRAAMSYQAPDEAEKVTDKTLVEGLAEAPPDPQTAASQEIIDKVAALAGWITADELVADITALLARVEAEARRALYIRQFPLTHALTVLEADARDANRRADWRYGVRHSLTLIRRALLWATTIEPADDVSSTPGAGGEAPPRRRPARLPRSRINRA